MAKPNNGLDHAKIIFDDAEMLVMSELNDRVDELDEVLNRAEELILQVSIREK